MNQKNKLILTTMTLGFLLFPGILLAQSGTVNFVNPIPYNTVEEVVGSFLTALQSIIALLAVLFIVVGGIMYMTGGGDEKMIERAKATITGAVIGLAVAIGAPALLNEIFKILGKSANPSWPSKTLYEIISSTLNLLLSFVGLLAIIGMVVGGIYYMTSAGDEERIETAKKIVTYSIVGISVALLGLVIVKAVAYIVAGTA